MPLIKKARLKLLVVNSVKLHLTAYMYLEQDRFKYTGRTRNNYAHTVLADIEQNLDITKLAELK